MSRNLATHIDSREAVAARLKALRTEAGLSMKQMAALVGCVPGYLSRIEKGLRIPSLQMFEVFARVLNETGRVSTTAQFLACGQRGVPTLTEATEAELRGELTRRAHLTLNGGYPVRLSEPAGVSFVHPAAPNEGGTS